MADTDEGAGLGSGLPDDRQRRPPQTIDAQAVEVPVENAGKASSGAYRAQPRAPRPRASWFALLTAGFLGAVLALAGAGAGFIYLLPPDQRSPDDLIARIVRLVQPRGADESAPAAASSAAKTDAANADAAKIDAAKIEELAGRLARLESAARTPVPAAPDPALDSRLAAVEAAEKTVADRVADLDRRSRDDAAAVQAARERAEAAATAVAAIPPPPALDPTLGSRLATVEAAEKTVADRLAELDRRSRDGAAAAQAARERAEAAATAVAAIPPPAVPDPTLGNRLTVVEGAAKTITDRLADLDRRSRDDAAAAQAARERAEAVASAVAAIPPPAAPDPTLGNRLATVETEAKTIADRLAELDRRTQEDATAAKAARERAEAVASAIADVNRADADQDKLQQSAQAELAGLSDRLGMLETLVTHIRDEVAEAAVPKVDELLRVAVVATALRGAVERGEPFAAELAAAKTLGADRTALAGLEPFAVTGVPNPADLFRELSGLIPEMLKVSAPAASPEGSYLDRLQAHAEKLVRIRPVGDHPGDDPATVIGRIDRDMARRDVASVVAELDKLPAPALAIVEPWRKKALGRQAATAAASQFVAVSFAKLGAPAGDVKR